MGQEGRKPQQKNPATLSVTVFIYTNKILVLEWVLWVRVRVCACLALRSSTVQRYKRHCLLLMPTRQVLHSQLLTRLFLGFTPSPTAFRRPHSALREGLLGARHAHLRSKLMSETVHVTQGCSIGTDRLWPWFQLSLQLWILMLLHCGNFPHPFLQSQGITSFSPISCSFLFRESFSCYTSTSITVKCLNLVSETPIKSFKIRKEPQSFCRKLVPCLPMMLQADFNQWVIFLYI